METACISFGGFVFSINPSELEIQYERIMSERVVPFFGTSIADLGTRRKKVIGKGFLAGEGSYESFRELEEAFASGKPRILSIPGKEPFGAVLTALQFIGVTAQSVIGYGFVFTEADGFTLNKENGAEAQAGRSLWDFAYEYGIPIEALAKRNRDIRFINYLDKGQKIKLWIGAD